MHRYSRREPFDDRVLRGPDCWLWQGALNELGYGRATLDGETALAHRVAWMRATGGVAIPRGMLVLHTCDTPRCVRNDEPGVYLCNGVLHPKIGHLWLGTNADNVADKMAKGRHVALAGSEHWMHAKPDLIRRGSTNGNAKLTEADILDIRSRYAGGGVLQRDIALQYGISGQLVSAIVTRAAWRHVV